MTEHAELSHEIKALKDQIQHLKTAISSLQQDTEKKEVRWIYYTNHPNFM